MFTEHLERFFVSKEAISYNHTLLLVGSRYTTILKRNETLTAQKLVHVQMHINFPAARKNQEKH